MYSSLHGLRSDCFHVTHETGSVERGHILFIMQFKAFNLTVDGTKDS